MKLNINLRKFTPSPTLLAKAKAPMPRVGLSWGSWLCASLVLWLGGSLMPVGLLAAGVEVEWVQHFGPRPTALREWPRRAGFDPSGDVILLGDTDGGSGSGHFLTVKFSNETGDLLWKRLFEGSAQFGAFAVDVAGNVVVGAQANPPCVVKYAAADGAILWTSRAEGSGSRGYIYAVATDAIGNVFVAGEAYPDSGGYFYFTAKYAAADGAPLWIKHIPNEVVALAVDAGGNIIVTGSTYYQSNTDIYTAKYASADGAQLWAQRYDGPDHRTDQANTLVLDPDGNVIVMGTCDSNDHYDICTVKYAGATGAPLWQRHFTSAVSSYDYPREVLAAPNGDAAVTSYQHVNGGILTHLLRYAAADGATRWEKHGSFGVATVLDSDGNTVVFANEGTGDVPDYHLLKFAAADGALLGDQPCGNLPFNPIGVIGMRIEPAGDVVIAGSAAAVPGGSSFFAARLAAGDGGVLWQNQAHGPGYREASSVAMITDSHGDVFVLSRVRNGGIYDHYLSKHAAAGGALLWTWRFDGQTVDDSGHADEPVDGELALDAAGNIIVTAYALGPQRRIRYHTSKHASSNGAVLWIQEWDNPTGGDLGSQSLALDASGNVIVAAYSLGDPSKDSYLVKYAAADGAVLWERHCGCVDEECNDAPCYYFHDVAVDADGDVVAAGSGYTAKFSGVDGSLLWEHLSGGYAVFVTTDADRNVIVAGSASHGMSLDLYVAKYAAADGGLIWEGFANGPSDDTDYASAAAVDEAGNVAITGASWNGTHYYDMFTAKFSPEGVPLWKQSYGSSGTAYEGGAAVAFAPNGNVITCSYSDLFGVADFYLTEYAATDGKLVWETRYNGAAHRRDIPGGRRSLAIAPGGAILVGGQSDTGFDQGDNLMMVLIKYVAPPALERLPGNAGYLVEFSAVPGLSYTLQRAASPAGPWADLVTLPAPASGRLSYTDSMPLPGSAFYRTVTP